jgi:hypothetical protein
MGGSDNNMPSDNQSTPPPHYSEDYFSACYTIQPYLEKLPGNRARGASVSEIQKAPFDQQQVGQTRSWCSIKWLTRL